MNFSILSERGWPLIIVVDIEERTTRQKFRDRFILGLLVGTNMLNGYITPQAMTVSSLSSSNTFDMGWCIRALTFPVDVARYPWVYSMHLTERHSPAFESTVVLSGKQLGRETSGLDLTRRTF